MVESIVVQGEEQEEGHTVRVVSRVSYRASVRHSDRTTNPP